MSEHVFVVIEICLVGANLGSLVYLDVEVQTASGTLVAKGLVTYKLG